MKKVLIMSLLAVLLTLFFTACETTTQNPNTNSTTSTTSTTTTTTTSTTDAKHDVAYYSTLVESFSICLPEFSSPAELTSNEACTIFKFFDDWSNWDNFYVEGKGIVFPYTYVRDLLQKHLEYDITPQIRSLKDGDYDAYYDASLDAWVFPGEVLGFGGMRFSKNVSIDRVGDIVTIVQDFYNEDFSIKYARCTFVIHKYPDYYALLSYTSIDYVD